MSEKKYKCDLCVKSYTTYQTLWVHNKKFHNNIKVDTNIDNNKPIATFECRICKKCYKYKQSRHLHEKSCSGVPPENAELEIERAKQETERLKNETEKTKQETEKTKQETEKTKQETVKLEIRLQEMQLGDDDTVKSINKMMDSAHIAINSNNNNNNVITNNITNNINITFPNIIGYGAETEQINVLGILTDKDKDVIINSLSLALDNIVKIVHCGEYDFFKNVIITNLTKKYAYKYDESVKNFTKVDKTTLLDDMFEALTWDLNRIYEEFVEEKKLSNHTRIKFKKHLEELENKDDVVYDQNKKKYKNYKTYKMNDLNDILYINRHKIMDDIKAIIQDWNDGTKIEN